MSNCWATFRGFEKYVEAFGNIFAAINYVSDVARRRRNRVYNCISESQALTWVVSGIEPKDLYKNYKLRLQYLHRIDLYIEDRLCYIEDADVRDAVASSIAISQENRHLIYKYNSIEDEYIQARVRIICRMIWDEIQRLEAEELI